MAPSSYYRTPTKAPSSKWARHIDAWMRREGLSQTSAFKRLRGAFGLGEESRSAFLPYLVNKPLDDAQQAAVAAIIGWPPEVPEETQEPGQSPDVAGLVAALRNALQAQAEALTDIRLELARAAQDAEAQRVSTAALLGGLADQLDELLGLARKPAGSADLRPGRN